MRLHDYDAFILDMDGTLIDSGKYHARAFSDTVFKQSGYKLTRDEHFEFFATHSKEYSLVLNERYGLSLDPEHVLEKKRSRMKEIFKTELYEGALSFLERWHGKVPIALATNSPLSFTKPTLESVDLIRYFECITTADDVKNRKPDPEIFELSLQRLQADPKKTLVFEDQIMGLEAARNAGMHMIAVNNGQPVDFPNDVPVHSWIELLAMSEME